MFKPTLPLGEGCLCDKVAMKAFCLLCERGLDLGGAARRAYRLLVAEGVDGAEAGGAVGGVDAEEDADRG